MAYKITPIMQKHSSGCGPTSLRMAIGYFGLKISQKEIETACKDWKAEGMGNEDLIDSAKRLGLNVESFYDSIWEDLMTKNGKEHVLVVSWMMKGYIGHFSVVEKATKDHIWLADPESGKIERMPKMIFMRLWFDYGDKWYPETKADIRLRWIGVIGK